MSHLPFKPLVVLMYSWARDMSQQSTMHETCIERANTLVDWFTFCRKHVGVFMERHATELGGFHENGKSVIVEIDESKYFQRKYNRGQYREGQWVFGGIERHSKRCFLVEVADRRAATLEQLIHQHILPGTQIISGGWAAYANIDRLGESIYQLSVVIHQQQFVDPHLPEVHTAEYRDYVYESKEETKKTVWHQ
jgi:ISXO2-like transposase domain